MRILQKFFGKKIVATKCGHETKLKDKVTAFGESTETVIKMDKPEYYHRCLKKMAIQCAWCKRPIFIGDPVTLYTPTEKDFKKPEHAVIYNENPLQLVGCGRTSCADTGADYAGIWVPEKKDKGKVHRRPTMIEESIADLQKSGDGVIIR